MISEYFRKVFSDAKIVAQQSISGNSAYNSYYAPQFTDRLVRNCIPLSLLWSSIMLGMPTNHLLWAKNNFCLLPYSCITRRKPWTLRHKWTILGIFWILCQKASSSWSGKTLHFFFHKIFAETFVATSAVLWIDVRETQQDTGCYGKITTGSQANKTWKPKV